MMAECGLLYTRASCSQDAEPLGEGQLRIAGALRGSLARHVNHSIPLSKAQALSMDLNTIIERTRRFIAR